MTTPRNTLTAHYDEHDRLLIYDDKRSDIGDPVLAIEPGQELSLACFLLEWIRCKDLAYPPDAEISLCGHIGKLREE